MTSTFPGNIKYTRPNHLLCEGPSDVAFFERLMADRGLPTDPWDITSPRGKLSGVSAFTAHIQGLFTSGDIGNIERLLIVADNDTNPSGNFTGVRRQVREGGVPVPNKPLETARDESPTRLSVAILMLPWAGEQGCLETLLLEAAMDSNPNLNACISAFLGCCSGNDISTWSISRESKSRIHALIAAVCKEPACALQYVWAKDGNPIPIRSTRFDRIARFVADFAAT